MAEYFADNPQIIVNGFVKAGITAALDGQEDQQEVEVHEMEDDSGDDFEVTFSDDEDNSC